MGKKKTAEDRLKQKLAVIKALFDNKCEEVLELSYKLAKVRAENVSLRTKLTERSFELQRTKKQLNELKGAENERV